jgi:hypothetical protein
MSMNVIWLSIETLRPLSFGSNRPVFVLSMLSALSELIAPLFSIERRIFGSSERPSSPSPWKVLAGKNDASGEGWKHGTDVQQKSENLELKLE